MKENQRFYPNAPIGAHLIGFVSLDSKGLEGVEFQYDHQLSGGKQMWIMGKDAQGREIAEGEGPFQKEDQQRNITLTLDKQIQHVAETELNRAVQKWRAKGGMIIAMEPFDRQGPGHGNRTLFQSEPVSPVQTEDLEKQCHRRYV